MTNLTINTSTASITKSVELASKYVSTMSDDATVGQLIISGTKNVLQIKATNNIEVIIDKRTAFTSNDMTVDSFAPIAIDAKKLLKVLKSAKSDNVSFDINKDNVVIKNGRSKAKIALFDVVEDIEINTGDDVKSLTISDKLTLMMERITHSIDTNNIKYELNGASLQIKKNNLILASTDTKRLSLAIMPVESDDLNIVVPKRGILSITKIFGNNNLSAKIDDNSLTMEASNVIYSIKLINGKYPDIMRVVPKTFTETISLKRELLLSIVKEASVLEGDVIIEINNNKITVKDMNEEVEVTEEIEAHNVDIKFGIRSSNMIDFLSSYSEDDVEICFNEENLPVVLKGTEDYKEIMMPVVISEESSKKVAA